MSLPADGALPFPDFPHGRRTTPRDTASALPTGATITEILGQALAGPGGDIIVETDQGRGHIFVSNGSIAWVVSSNERQRLFRVIRRHADVPRAKLQVALMQCQKEGSNFAEALVRLNLIDRTSMRAALLEHNAWNFLSLLRSGSQRRVSFEPRDRAYSSDLLFDLSEIISKANRLEKENGGESVLHLQGSDNNSSHLLTSEAPASSKENEPRNDNQENDVTMANIQESLASIMELDGAIAAALVDWESGLTLGTVGGNSEFDIELAASGNTGVVKAKMAVMNQLGITGGIEDILITLESQYHLIRPLTKNPALFLYVAISKSKGNLGLARHKLRAVDSDLAL